MVGTLCSNSTDVSVSVQSVSATDGAACRPVKVLRSLCDCDRRTDRAAVRETSKDKTEEEHMTNQNK